MSLGVSSLRVPIALIVITSTGYRMTLSPTLNEVASARRTGAGAGSWLGGGGAVPFEHARTKQHPIATRMQRSLHAHCTSSLAASASVLASGLASDGDVSTAG